MDEMAKNMEKMCKNAERTTKLLSQMMSDMKANSELEKNLTDALLLIIESKSHIEALQIAGSTMEKFVIDSRKLINDRAKSYGLPTDEKGPENVRPENPRRKSDPRGLTDSRESEL